MNDRTLQFVRVWEWRAWILLLYAIPLHEAAKNALWAIGIALAATRFLLEPRKPRPGLAGWGVLVWLVAGLWTTVFAIEPAASLKGLWDMARGAGMFGLAISVGDTSDRRAASVRHMIFAAALAGSIGLVDYAWSLCVTKAYAPKLAVQLRSVGHYNQSGAWLAMAWAFALASALHGSLIRRKWIASATCVVIGLALAGSTSRTAIGGALVTTVALFWIARPRRWLRVALLSLIPAILLAMAMSPPLRGRLLSRGSFHNRTAIWQSTETAIRSRPWTGVGLNNFKNIMLTSDETTHFATVDHAHNLYVSSLAQGGWPGLAALMAMLGTTAAAIARLRGSVSPETRLIFRAALGVWLTLALIGLSNTSLHHELAMMFFAAMGLAVAEDLKNSTRDETPFTRCSS